MSDYCSFGGLENQERFLLSEKATGVRSLLPVSFAIDGDLDAERLVQALEHLVAKREMLRSRLVSEKTGTISVETARGRNGSVVQKDLSNLDLPERQLTLETIIADALSSHEGFFCAVLVRLGAKCFSLTLIPHHAVVDGVSIGSLLSEISRLYNIPGLELDCDEGHFERACRDIESREAAARETDIAYWSSELAGLAAQPDIPTAIRQTDRTVGETGWVVEQIPAELHASARTLARKIGVRTFSLYLGVGQVALQRLTGEMDIAVSIQSAGRRSFGVDDQLIGMFSRALIIRSPAETQYAISDRLRVVDSRVSGALDHETLSYQHAIRIAGTSPRFAFNWYPVQEGLVLNGCICREEILCPWPTTFDLNFHFLKRPDGLEMRTFFNRRSCDETSARVAARCIRHLIEAAVGDAERSVAALPSLGAQPLGKASFERQEWGRVDARFHDQADKTPDRVAISHPGGMLSYGELKAEVTHLASLFRKHATPQPRVAVIGHRGPGLAIGALAALEAGGSFTLIDPCYPDARIRSMIEVLDPDIVVVCDGLIVDPPDMTNLEASEIDSGAAVFGIRRLLFRATGRSAEDRCEVAYWLFTSGSTGQPKCLSTDHAPLLNALDWQRRSFGIDSEDRVSFLSGVSHDPALRDLFLPLLSGGRICTPDPARLFEPGYLFGWIGGQGISVAHLTPAMVRLVEIGAVEGETLDSLRAVFIGGDRAGFDLVDTLAKRAPHARLINVYGASETPQIVLYKELERGFGDGRGASRVIGLPRPDVSVRIVDLEGRICGLHETGEIVIETAYLSNGYLNPRSQNGSSFRFSEAGPGHGSYWTGDRGYLSEDREVVLIGRVDNQVKIRGFRVEPDEITAHLQALTGSPSAIVTARKNEAGTAFLVGFMERDVNMPDERAILAGLAEQVPNYMVPDHLVVLDRMPLLPNGKIDRQALGAMPLPAPSEQDNYTAPQTPEEERLVSLWENVLGISPIGVNDDFFNLGGDSLTAVRLMLEMERAGLSEETARAILQGATIRELAQSGESGTMAAARSEIIPPGPLLSRLSVHGLRGLLVILIVAGHWFPGIIARLPALEEVGRLLTPLFNLSTPGFAIMFGMSLGYFNYDTYLQRPSLYRRQVWYGLVVLAAALAVIAALKLSTAALNGRPITTHVFFLSFYNVLGFYLLAVASMPLWFAWMRQTGGGVAAMAALLLVYVMFDLAMRWAFLRYEPDGLVQLLRLYATAKFSYFNMSIGAIAGLIAGDMIRRRHDLPYRHTFLVAGPAMIVAGLVWGGFLGGLDDLLSATTRLSYWKWCLYFGVILYLCTIFWPLMSRYGHQRSWRSIPLKLLGAVGILALPFFVFHGMILDIKGVLDVLAVPDLIGITLVLSLFFGLGGIAVRRIWRLYYL